jgi:hypothetical protein
VLPEDVGSVVLLDVAEVRVDDGLAAAVGIDEVLLVELEGDVLLVVVHQLDAVILEELDGVGHLSLEDAAVLQVGKSPAVLLHSPDPVMGKLVVPGEPQVGHRPPRRTRALTLLADLDQRDATGAPRFFRRLQEAQRGCGAGKPAADNRHVVVGHRPLLSHVGAISAPARNEAATTSARASTDWRASRQESPCGL